MNPGNVAKIDSYMSVLRDFPPSRSGTTFRYLLCSTARCGSNMVSDMLLKTGRAGDPLEYLNPRYMAGYQRSIGAAHANQPSFARYLDEIERRRSSPNGHFGIKMHFEHLEANFSRDMKQALLFLKRFDRVVSLRRRDKLAQAVSLHRARVTQLWSADDRRFLAPDDPRLHKEVKFDPVAISRALAEIVRQESAWERLLKSASIPFEIFWYEDFVSDCQTTFQRLLKVLSIQEDAVSVSPSTRRQSSENDPILATLCQYLGCNRDQ